MRTWPESGVSRRVTHRATVDFPEPESPTSASVCPREISKCTERTASMCTRFRHRPPRTYCFERPLTHRIGLGPRPLDKSEAGLIGKLLPILETVHGPRGLRHELLRVAAGADLLPFRAARFKPTTNRGAGRIGCFPVNGRETNPQA